MRYRSLNQKEQDRLKESAQAQKGGNKLFHLIRAWALSEDGGALPEYSARPFAGWLFNVWENWTEEPETTVGDVLKGAVSDWCGGRTE